MGAEWIRLAGELDLSSVDILAEQLDRSLASSYLVAVDLRDLDFIDCAALRVLVAARADARRASRSFVLIRGGGQVDRMMEMLGLLGHFEVVDLPVPKVAYEVPAGESGSFLPPSGVGEGASRRPSLHRRAFPATG